MNTIQVDGVGDAEHRSPKIEQATKLQIVRMKMSEQIEKQFSPHFRQFLGNIPPFFIMVAVGNMIGFSAILIRQLKDEDSLIKVTRAQGSWLASVNILSKTIGCIFCGFTMELYGRKTIMLFACAALPIALVITYLSLNYYTLLFGRLLTGLCAGFLTPPMSVYTSEMSQPSYRAYFTATHGLAVAVGILITHALGIYIKWNVLSLVTAIIPILAIISLGFVPESPSWYLKEGNLEAAADAFRWFRGTKQKALDEFATMVEAQQSPDRQEAPISLINFFKLARKHAFLKPLVILIVYFATYHFTGSTVITSYTHVILQNVLGDGINEYTGTIVLDVTRIFATLLGCFVVKEFGRRPLTIFSGLTTSAALFGLAIYLYVSAQNSELRSYYVIPLILFTLYEIVLNVGIHPLAWTLKSELFPLRYRGIGASALQFVNNLFLFASIKSSPALFASLGEQGVFLMFAVCTLLGIAWLTIYLPETHNKTLQDIEDSYEKRSTKEEPTEMAPRP